MSKVERRPTLGIPIILTHNLLRPIEERVRSGLPQSFFTEWNRVADINAGAIDAINTMREARDDSLPYRTRVGGLKSIPFDTGLYDLGALHGYLLIEDWMRINRLTPPIIGRDDLNDFTSGLFARAGKKSVGVDEEGFSERFGEALWRDSHHDLEKLNGETRTSMQEVFGVKIPGTKRENAHIESISLGVLDVIQFFVHHAELEDMERWYFDKREAS